MSPYERGPANRTPEVIAATRVHGKCTSRHQAVEELAALQRAARAAVQRTDLDFRERLAVIVELGRRARASSWSWTAARAVWAEVGPYLRKHGAPSYQVVATCTRCGTACPLCSGEFSDA